MSNLSLSEKKLVVGFLRLRYVYLALIGIFLLLGFGFSFFMFKHFIPAYTAPLEAVPNHRLHGFIRAGFISMARMNMLWVFFIECVLIGSFIMYSKMSRIIKKL